MKQPKKLTRDQKNLIVLCGLNVDGWACHYEDKNYLHIVRKGQGPNEVKIIDKKNKEVLGTE